MDQRLSSREPVIGDGQRFAALLGEPRIASQALGGIYIAGAVLGAACAIFLPSAMAPEIGPTLIAAALAVAAGTVLLSGTLGKRSTVWLSVASAVGTLLITVGGYHADPDGTAFRYLYLWLVPVVFAVLPRRHIIGNVTLMAACSAIVPVLRPVESNTNQTGAWIVSTVTIVLVGVGLRAIVASIQSLEGRVGRAYSQSPIGMALVDTDGTFLDVNDALSSMLRRSRADLVGTSVIEVTHPDHLEHLVAAMTRTFDHPGTVTELEKRCITGDGSLLWSRLILTRLGDSIFAQAQDVTAEWLLTDGTLHDQLTGLASRALAIDRLGQQLIDHNTDSGVAVVVVDLDGFAAINDSFGHEIADDVLKAVARRLSGAEPAPHTVARLGGDEFAVLYSGVQYPAEAVGLAGVLLDTFAEPLVVAGSVERISVSASAGVSLGVIGDDPDETLRNALTALHQAKVESPGAVRVYNHAMRDVAATRIRMEEELRTAVREEQFLLDYQPVVDVSTGSICAIEALVRWAHPVDGLIRPDLFIPLAEEIGMINQLGAWVMRTAAAQLTEWRRHGLIADDVRVAVNVSARQVADPTRFLAEVRSVLADEPGAAGGLVIELTESTIADNQRVPHLLDDLRDLDVRIHLDDFGTGYSSFGTLKTFPIDAIKIDRSFVEAVHSDDRDVALVRAMIQMADTLGLVVIGEGVEIESQRRILEELGCRHMQGFGLHRPMNDRALSELFAQQAHRSITTT